MFISQTQQDVFILETKTFRNPSINLRTYKGVLGKKNFKKILWERCHGLESSCEYPINLFISGFCMCYNQNYFFSGKAACKVKAHKLFNKTVISF